MAYAVGYMDIVEGVDTGLSANAKIRDGFTNTQTALNALDNRATILESWTNGFLKPIFSGSSAASSQQPVAVNTELQVEFGAAQNSVSDDAMMDVNGTITFNVAGTYRIKLSASCGRVGAAALSIVSYRWLVNDVAYGNALVTQAENASDIRPILDELIVVASAGDTLKGQLMLDSAGGSVGGFYSTTFNAVGWGTVPCASIEVKRLV